MSFTQAQILAAAKVLHDEDSLMDPKPHSYERLSLPARIAYEDVATRVLAAALRAAGGQEGGDLANQHHFLPSGGPATPGGPELRCTRCGIEWADDHYQPCPAPVGGQAAKPERKEQPAGHGLNALCILDGCDAHPVGGQAEPSDAIKHDYDNHGRCAACEAAEVCSFCSGSGFMSGTAPVGGVKSGPPPCFHCNATGVVRAAAAVSGEQR